MHRRSPTCIGGSPRPFRSLDVDYEIIFVNDASPDDAREVLAQLAATDARVVVVNHARNFGSQSAFTSGMRVATGDAVVLLDGDLQDPPELIARFHERWLEGWDVVYGVREQRVASRLMRVSYKLFYRLFRMTAYVPVPLDAGDFSLLDRRVVEALNALPESHRFVRGLRAWVGCETGVPVLEARSALRQLDQLATSESRLGAARRPVVLLCAARPHRVARVRDSRPLDRSRVRPARSQDRRSLHRAEGLHLPPARHLLPRGIQLLCLAIIGSYLAHIYEEAAQAPPTLRRRERPQPARNRPSTGRSHSRLIDLVEAIAALVKSARGAVLDADRMTRVIVTGAAGFIGANVGRRRRGGPERFLLTSPSSLRWRLAELDGEAPIVEVDLGDHDAVARNVAEF